MEKKELETKEIPQELKPYYFTDNELSTMIVSLSFYDKNINIIENIDTKKIIHSCFEKLSEGKKLEIKKS